MGATAFSDVTSSEVRIVERVYRDGPERKLGGGLKDRLECERCGRPVKVDSDDDMREEILCLDCAADAQAAEVGDDESA